MHLEGWQVFCPSPFPGNTGGKMLENFVKINQSPRLVKQQLDSLFRIFSTGTRWAFQ